MLSEEMKKADEKNHSLQLEYINALRSKIDSIFSYKNTADKLLQEKVDEYILVEELPIAIKIGARTIYVGNFTIQNQYTFFNEYPKILAHVGMQSVDFDMLCNGDKLYKYLMINKKLYNGLCKLIGKTILKQQQYYTDSLGGKHKLPKVSVSYFMRNVSIEKLIQIYMLIYLYNFEAEKKNLQIVMSKTGGVETSQTYIYKWLQNLGGLKGSFSNAQLIDVSYWQDESTKAEAVNG